MKNKIYSEREAEFSATLKKLLVTTKSDFGLIKDIGRVLQYYDEPKPWQYSASIDSKFLNQKGRSFDSAASGISFFSEKYALLKCLSEAIERYCNFSFFKSSDKIISTFKVLKNDAIDPISIVGFSKNQLKSDALKKFRINNNSVFSWTQGKSLTTNQNILIPSQLIYLSYPFLKDEPSIYPSISTGCAGGECLSAALVRGICEIIERDAFMIFYLNKLPATKIQLELIDDSRIKALLNTFKRYCMEVYSFDLTTDITVPTFLSIVINRTGIGKSVSIGMKCGLDSTSALVGSIEETFTSRTWLRTEFESHPGKVSASDLLKKSDIKTRGFLWYPKSAIKKLDFLLNSQKRTSQLPLSRINKTSGEQLEILVSLLSKLGLEIIYKNITAPIFKKLNFFVAKVIIPKAQPFYLNESKKLLGGERLYKVPGKLGFKTSNSKLNNFPHPFL